MMSSEIVEAKRGFDVGIPPSTCAFQEEEEFIN
jgi:hypothetical protein